MGVSRTAGRLASTEQPIYTPYFRIPLKNKGLGLRLKACSGIEITYKIFTICTKAYILYMYCNMYIIVVN